MESKRSALSVSRQSLEKIQEVFGAKTTLKEEELLQIIKGSLKGTMRETKDDLEVLKMLFQFHFGESRAIGLEEFLRFIQGERVQNGKRFKGKSNQNQRALGDEDQAKEEIREILEEEFLFWQETREAFSRMISSRTKRSPRTPKNKREEPKKEDKATQISFGILNEIKSPRNEPIQIERKLLFGSSFTQGAKQKQVLPLRRSFSRSKHQKSGKNGLENMELFLKRLFKFVDKDSNGELDYSDISSFMQDLKLAFNYLDFDSFMKRCGNNKGESLRFSEFFNFLKFFIVETHVKSSKEIYSNVSLIKPAPTTNETSSPVFGVKSSHPASLGSPTHPKKELSSKPQENKGGHQETNMKEFRPHALKLNEFSSPQKGKKYFYYSPIKSQENPKDSGIPPWKHAASLTEPKFREKTIKQEKTWTDFKSEGSHPVSYASELHSIDWVSSWIDSIVKEAAPNSKVPLGRGFL